MKGPIMWLFERAAREYASARMANAEIELGVEKRRVGDLKLELLKSDDRAAGWRRRWYETEKELQALRKEIAGG